MKKKYIISLIIIVSVTLFFVLKHQIIGKELKISFITSQKHTPKSLADNWGLNCYEWLIITNENQKNNFERDGYFMPFVDFNKNYLIISRYKISKLYQKAGINRCVGVPDGHAIFDKENSNKDFYYFYLMPNIILSQGIG